MGGGIRVRLFFCVGRLPGPATAGPAMTIAAPVPSDGYWEAALESDGTAGRLRTSDRAIVIALPTVRSEEAILSCTNFQIFVDPIRNP